MADTVRKRPFDNFRVAITDPLHFFGRSDLLEMIQLSPFQVHVLLGGRRLGKTSTLRAVEWNLLNPNSSISHRAFPVFISLQVEQPKDLDNLRYLLIVRLREAIDRWRKVPGGALRERYRQFLHQVAGGEVAISFLQQVNVKLNIKNPDHERRLIHDAFRQALLETIRDLQKQKFEGICFLLDESEFIVRQEWANDAWSYFRGLKDTDTALKPFLGFLLSGYRDLKDYQQQVGSPLLNIAEVKWLNTLTNSETQKLIAHRYKEEQFQLSEQATTAIMEWAGFHPYLTQQMINAIFDARLVGKSLSAKSLFSDLLRHHDHDFSAWWNENQQSDGFSNTERVVYNALVECRQGTPESLSQLTRLALGEVEDALDVLAGTGVIQKLDDERCMIGAWLFEKWVARQRR